MRDIIFPLVCVFAEWARDCESWLDVTPGARERCYSFATSVRKSLDGEFGAADIREESSPSKARKIESEGIYPSVKVKPDILLQPTEKKIINSVSTGEKKN